MCRVSQKTSTMERGSKSSWLCKIVKSIHTPADVLKLQRYLNKCSNVVPVIEEDTLEQFDRIIRNVFNPFVPNDVNHSYLMVILNSVNLLCQKNCFADFISPNHERQPEFCTKFAVLMKLALKYIATYINVGDKSFLTLLSVFKEIILCNIENNSINKFLFLCVMYVSQKSSEHIYLKNVFLRALSYLILKLIINGKVEFPLKKILLDLMVNLLEETDRQTRSDTFHKVKSLLCMMLKSLHKYGDYRTQMSAVEIIIRFTTLVPNERVDIAKSIENEEICQRFAKFSPRNFEMECRIILNLLNHAHGQNSNVFTIACDKAFVGDYSIKKPKHEDYKELWVDFNLNSQSITVCCDGDSLMCVEENRMPEQSGFWEILTVTSKNVRKLSIVPSDGSFSGKDGITVMHLKLASPCEYIHATSAAAISRCREICFYFKQSPEFKDLEDRILPQIFRGRHQERKGSVTPDITLNVCQMLEQKKRGKSRQLPKTDQESNEASPRNNKNSESCRFSSYSEEMNVIGASEKLEDDPEKQLETLQADLLKEIMQESEILGSKHTQTANSADASLKELYNKLAAHKFVKYSAVSPCAKKPDLSQIHEALSNGKQNITQTSTEKIFSNSVSIPAVQESLTVNVQSAAKYVVNNTDSKENERIDCKQNNLLQKESKFSLKGSGGLVAPPNGKQSINQTSTQKIFSNSDVIPVVQKPVNVSEENASECVVNNTHTKEYQRMDDKQKNMSQKESKFCLDSSRAMVADESVQETNSTDCAGELFLHDIMSQVYKKPELYQSDCVTVPLTSKADIMKKPTDVVSINAKGNENGLSAVCNLSSEQHDFILDNVSLRNSDVRSNQILSETKFHTTGSESNEDKQKQVTIEQKIVEINSTKEMTRDSGNADSINTKITEKINEQLRKPTKHVGTSLKKGKLSISLQKSINDKNFKNNRFENETQSKPDLFLKNDVAKVTNSSEKGQETTLISCSEIQENYSNVGQKSTKNIENEAIGNLPQLTQRDTGSVRCKDVLVHDILPENVQEVYEKPMEQPCKNLQPIIFKTPISEASVPSASTKCNSKEKRKTKHDNLQLQTTPPDEKLFDKSEIAARQMLEGVVSERQGVSSNYTPKLSEEGILATKDKCSNGVGQDMQSNDLSLSSSNSSPLFQPIKRDSHGHLGRRIERKYFNTDKNSKDVDTKVTYEKLCKKSNGKTEHRISGRRRLFSSEAGIEIINVLFSSKKYEQTPEKKLSRTVSTKKVNIATTKVVQHDVICKKGCDNKNSRKNQENFEISESDSSWHKIFPANKTKSSSKNSDKKKTFRYKKLTADNSGNHNLNREGKNKVLSEISDLDASWRNIFPTNSKKKCNYNSTTELKTSKQNKQTNLNTERPKTKNKTASTVNTQNNSMHDKINTKWSCLPQKVLNIEKMRGDSFEDEDNLISSKDAVKEASEMFFGKKEDKNLFDEFPSLIVEKEKKVYTEPCKYFDYTEIKDPFKEICPTTNIRNECSTGKKPTVVKSWNKELDNAFANNSDVSLEGKDITSNRRVDILHSSDESENHYRNQPLLPRLWEENCKRIHCNTYKRRRSHDRVLKNNEIQTLIKGSFSPSVESKSSLKQIPERELSSKFGTSCITHNLNSKSCNNQSSNNGRETKAAYSSNVVVAATCSSFEGIVTTSTRNYNPAQNALEPSRSVKLNDIREVKKPDLGTNTVDSANTHVNHTQNAGNGKLLLSSTGGNRRTTSTPCSVPGSLCFSSKTGISPIESVKNYTSRKNVDNFYAENFLNKPIVTDRYNLEPSLGGNNLKNISCRLSSVERNAMSDDVDKKSCKEIESDTKKQTSTTLDSNEYSWEEDAKNIHHREKSLSPPKQLNEKHWYESTLDQDQEKKRSCTEVKNKGRKTKISVGKKGNKYVDTAVCETNTEMEMSNNDSIEGCDVYSASLSSFSSRVNSEVSSGCHLNSDISLQSKRRRLNKRSVMQKQKTTDIYSHKEKMVCRRSSETVKYRHSIITLSQEQWKTANENANEDNENDSSCQPSEGNEVQNLLVSSLQKRMKIHKDYSEAVVKTIANTAAELTTCCQDEWQKMVKEYEEKVKNSFEKVNTMLQESISQQNEFHKFLKKYASESQNRYMTVKKEAQVLSACTKEMSERLSEMISYKEDICSQNIQEKEKLLNQEADQIIARERSRNRALVHEKVCHALNKRK